MPTIVRVARRLGSSAATWLEVSEEQVTTHIDFKALCRSFQERRWGWSGPGPLRWNGARDRRSGGIGTGDGEEGNDTLDLLGGEVRLARRNQRKARRCSSNFWGSSSADPHWNTEDLGGGVPVFGSTTSSVQWGKMERGAASVAYVQLREKMEREREQQERNNV